MPCLNLKQIMSQKHFYAHLLDSTGITIQKDSLNKHTMALILITTFAMTVAENPLIIPSFAKIFPDKEVRGKLGIDELNGVIKKYFDALFESFCLLFSDDEQFPGLVRKLEDGLDLNSEFLIYQKLKDFECKFVFKDYFLSN